MQFQDNLLILKIIFCEISKNNTTNAEEAICNTKTYLIEEISSNFNIFHSSPFFPNVLLNSLNAQQIKQFTKTFVKTCYLQPELNILENESIINNKEISTAITVEILKTLLKLFEKQNGHPCLNKAITKRNFDISEFFKEINMKEYFRHFSNDVEFNSDQIDTILKSIEFLKKINVFNLDEPCILAMIFVLLVIKSVANNKKKLRKNIDTLLQILFELPPKYPNIFQIFPIDFIFSFPDNKFLNLVTLSKTSNRLLIIKIILTTAVKKVKTDSDIIKKIVKILLSNQKNKDDSSIEYFSNDVFQISCIILPLIAKEKKAITTSAYRTILAELQEKLHKSLLKSFKSIDFSHEKSLFLNGTDNPEESVISESTVATLNAIEAFSLTLCKYCETKDVEEIKNLDCLWSGLGYFVEHAVSVFFLLLLTCNTCNFIFISEQITGSNKNS